jgi:glycosyltransferase involved in cell wall biosynthesis
VKISVAIICFNEERIIEACLMQARKLADEIIIIDSGSCDKTLEIATKYTNKIFHQAWLGYSKQKNLAIDKCSNAWILSLDADEVLTDELIQEIKDLKIENFDAYKISRKLFINKRFIRYGGYYPDYQLRLFRKDLGKFNDREVHESIELASDKITNLKEPLNHYAYESFSDMQKAFDKYSALGKKPLNPIWALLKSIYTFTNKYFLRLGFLEGTLGLKLALMHANYTLKKYLA